MMVRIRIHGVAWRPPNDGFVPSRRQPDPDNGSPSKSVHSSSRRPRVPGAHHHPPGPDRPMYTLVRRFIKTGIAFLAVGLALGAYMLVRRELGGVWPSPYLVSAHTHALLAG